MATTFTMRDEIDASPDRFWELFWDAELQKRIFLKELGFPKWEVVSHDDRENEIVVGSVGSSTGPWPAPVLSPSPSDEPSSPPHAARVVVATARATRTTGVLQDFEMFTEPRSLAQDANRLANVRTIVAADDRFAAFQSELSRYLELYGIRCVHELKLEAHSLRDRPHLVYEQVRAYLERGNPDRDEIWRRLTLILSEPTLPADLLAP